MKQIECSVTTRSSSPSTFSDNLLDSLGLKMSVSQFSAIPCDQRLRNQEFNKNLSTFIEA